MAHCSDERVARQGSEALMKVEVPYGETTITADLPDTTRVLSNIERASLPPLSDLDRAVRAALSAPRGLPRIGALVRPGATVTIAFDDHTTGSFGPIRRVAIQAVLDELEGAGVRRRDVTLICANALHRMLRPAELARLLGADLVTEFGDRLLCHDAEDPALIVDLGETADHGYPVEVHRLVTDS
ncbi:MAG: hypothetical protein DME16_14030, partial [Candidatus Rokuibacteriota bacterium]